MDNLNTHELTSFYRAQQCLGRRIPDREVTGAAATAWHAKRNAADASVDWQFTTEDARIKLKRLYSEMTSWP